MKTPEEMAEVMSEQKKTYYVGTYEAYRHEVRSQNLDPMQHIFMTRLEKFVGLSRDILIRSVGPVEASRTIVKELRTLGFAPTVR
jgi:hypothetical protein